MAAAGREIGIRFLQRCLQNVGSSPCPGRRWRGFPLVADAQRNEMIFADLQEALAQGRSPLLLTERVEHLDYFAERLQRTARNVLVLRGGMGARQRRALAEKLAAIPDGEERVLLSTGRYIGEGFDIFWIN